jgi:Flp pilus assembly protein TadD
MAIFGLNAAAALETAGAPEATDAGGAGVIELYRECSRLLFRQEAWEDLDRALTALRRRDPSDPAAESIEGKIAFQDGDYTLAEKYLRPLAEAGYDDSTVHYLCALIDLQAGDAEAAYREIGEACRLEPDYPLYRFKKAEIAYLLGRPDPDEAREAVRLDDTNGWAWNLLGLILLEGDAPGDAAEALDALGKAAGLLPEEPEPLINRSAALIKTEGADAALASLDAPEFTDRSGACTSAAILNRRGNILSEAGRYEEASQAYLAAVALEPGDPLWRENAAAALLAADRVPEADRLLARLLEEEATAARYRLMGQSALRTGEYSRAEAAFKAALEADPKDPMCRLDFVEMQLLRERFSEADKALAALEAEPQPFEAVTRRIAFLRGRLRTTGGTEYRCAGCSRTWWVPKGAAAPDQLRLRGEPPAEAPAGQCPSCGAVYCVACGMEHLSEGRFHCPDCKVPLKLNNAGLRYLMMKLVDNGAPPETQP